MKKSKLAFGLVAGFVGTLALTSCAGVTAKTNCIVEIKDYNGNVVEIVADDVYNEHAHSSAGIGSYYNSVLETLIRFNYRNSKFSGLKDLSRTDDQSKQEATNEVASEKKKAEQTAKSNKTSFDEEWEKVLDGKNVETEADLVEYYIYQYEKEDMVSWYYESNKANLAKQFIGTESVENVNSMFPYHVRHILVKTSGTKNNYTRDTISESEAENLSNLMKLLTQTKDGKRVNSFSAVAGMSINEDTSKDSYGDLGIVTTETSFVNEFKLGMYAFDAVFNDVDHTGSTAIIDALGINDYLENSTTTDIVGDVLINDIGLKFVDKQVFADLGDYKDKVKDNNGMEVCDGAEVLYPRNILWNRNLNIHSPFLITSDAEDDLFKPFTYNGATKYALTDENGHFVFGVRSEYGIHWIVVDRSMFNETNVQSTNPKYTCITLEDYYTTDVDKATASDKVTYITAINSNDTRTNYQTRADAIKSAVKSFDKTYDYRLFEALSDPTITGGFTVEFKDAELEAKISAYIKQQKLSNKSSADESLNSAWRTYIEMLLVAKEDRVDYEWDDTNKNYVGKMYKDVCIQKFGTANTDSKTDFEKGGDCYYGK